MTAFYFCTCMFISVSSYIVNGGETVRRSKKFFINTIILTSTSLFMRIVGVSFNVYISNKLGASGVGLFQLIMSVYVFATTLACSGINLTTTRLVAESLADESGKNIKNVVTHCLIYSLVFGTLSAFLLFVNADYIGKEILSDTRTIKSLKALAMSLPAIALSSVMSGYFTAIRKVIKSASAQIFEQFIRIFIVIFGLNLLMPKGIEYACLAVVCGGSIAEILSCVLQYILYKNETEKYKNNNKPKEKITSKMLCIALPVALSGYIRSALTTTEHILIPKKLKSYGCGSEQALAQYGIIHGMVMPILLFPSAFLSAFSLLLVPEVAECYARKNNRRISKIISRIIHITLIFTIGISGILYAFANELGFMIYKSAEAGFYIKILAPLISVMYLDGVVDAMLKGLNQQMSSMRYNILDAFLSVVLVCLLIPSFGVGGYIATIFISEIINGFLSLNKLIKISDFKIKYYDWIIKPICAIIFSIIMVKEFYFKFINSASGSNGILICLIGICALIYIMMLFILSCINDDDLKMLKSMLIK